MKGGTRLARRVNVTLHVYFDLQEKWYPLPMSNVSFFKLFSLEEYYQRAWPRLFGENVLMQ
jgi:hypothetical protein